MGEEARIRIVVDRPPREGGRYVQYWMQQAMRAEHNPALDHAIELANDLGVPVLVSFGLTAAKGAPYPDANARHYAFLLEGLVEVEATLAARGIAFVIRAGQPPDVTLALSEEAAIVVCDRGYLKPQRGWQAEVARRIACRLVEVETDAVVPVDLVSGKHEYGARTIRPKIERLWDDYLVAHRSPALRHKAEGLDIASDIDLADVAKVVAGLKVDHSVGPVKRFTGGLKAARKRLSAFVAKDLDGYDENRNLPELESVSHLSPWFHFGQISPIEVALAIREGKAARPSRAAYLEELIVRRELAFNHVLHEPRYDSFAAVPDWARKTLHEHGKDPRPFLYDRAQLEAGETHDRYWNVAMREMRETGYMHNRLRMYWGKKILEWSKTPEEAFDTALAINNRYFVDGRDANSFTNIAWLFGLHDRPWTRRPVFGTVRYMSENTFRKFNPRAYEHSVDRLCRAEG